MTCDPTFWDVAFNAVIVIMAWELTQVILRPVLDATIGKWLTPPPLAISPPSGLAPAGTITLPAYPKSPMAAGGS